MSERAHEYIPFRRPVAAGELRSLAGIPELSDATIVGACLPDVPVDGYLSFSDRISPGPFEPSPSRSWILVPKTLAAEMAERLPDARIVPVDDARACFIDTLEEVCAAGLNGRSSQLPAEPGVHPEAVVGYGAVVSPDACVEAGARIGDGAVLAGPVWVCQGATIGEGAVLGSVGINAYVGQDGKRRAFPHIAATIIGPESHIGAQSVIMKGILSSTSIGPGSIIGSLCNIGHGSRVGTNCWISAGTIIGGHATIGDGATLALNCTIKDNCAIGADANVGMGSVVTKKVSAGSSVFGNPASRQHRLTTGPKR